MDIVFNSHDLLQMINNNNKMMDALLLLTDSCSLASCDKASLVWLNSIDGLLPFEDDDKEDVVVSEDVNEFSVFCWWIPIPILVLLLILYSISVVSSNCCE